MNSCIPDDKKKSIVYQVPYAKIVMVSTQESPNEHCKSSCHKRAVVRSVPNNGIAVHEAENEHRVDWGECKSSAVSAGILGEENYRSNPDQTMQDINELGQWPQHL